MSEITRLLDDYTNGNREVLDELLPLVYNELRRLAHSYLAGERQGITLQRYGGSARLDLGLLAHNAPHSFLRLKSASHWLGSGS